MPPVGAEAETLASLAFNITQLTKCSRGKRPKFYALKTRKRDARFPIPSYLTMEEMGKWIKMEI